LKIYHGVRTTAGTEVTVNGTSLPLHLDKVNHSPTGFEWGYYGSGPAQLAFAILFDHLQNEGQAKALYQRFKEDMIAEAPAEWIIDRDHINEWLDSLKEDNTQNGNLLCCSSPTIKKCANGCRECNS
jgi:hypothetical protein